MAEGHHVRIEYCVPCSGLAYAAGLVPRVLEEWEGVIDVLEVVPGKGGIFDVHVDGELVFTKSMFGRYPRPDEVMPLLHERLAPG